MICGGSLVRCEWMLLFLFCSGILCIGLCGVLLGVG